MIFANQGSPPVDLGTKKEKRKKEKGRKEKNLDRIKGLTRRGRLSFDRSIETTHL